MTLLERQGSAHTEAFFEALLDRDATGRTWLADLLSVAPRARERLGELVERPGTLEMALSMRGISGRRGCLEVRAPVPRSLLRWYIEHPDRLSWPADDDLRPQERILRRALICDQPPGSRERAQERAREALRERSPLTPGWWRFEQPTMLDCVLMTQSLVVVIEGGGRSALGPVTPWYPQRPWLFRVLEGARELAAGRAWGALVVGGEALTETEGGWPAAVLAQAAPHLEATEREELADGFLGSITWRQATAAIDRSAGGVGRRSGG